MLIYANQGENGAADMILLHQKMRNWYLGNYKKEGEKSLRVLTGVAKNEMFGPSGPPYVLLVELCILPVYPISTENSVDIQNVTCDFLAFTWRIISLVLITFVPTGSSCFPVNQGQQGALIVARRF